MKIAKRKGGENMRNTDIKLTGNMVENIQLMAPHMTERQQYIIFGMLLTNAWGRADDKKFQKKGE